MLLDGIELSSRALYEAGLEMSFPVILVHSNSVSTQCFSRVAMKTVPDDEVSFASASSV